MKRRRMCLNAGLVLLIGGMSMGGTPDSAYAVAEGLGGGCGVCYYDDEECPSQVLKNATCATLCGTYPAGEACYTGSFFYLLYECDEGVPDAGWECGIL